jgi:imidazolonepropionase-like amidohydrolase
MKLRSVLILAALCELFVTFGFFPPTSAEEVAPRSIALVGGTLIDGTGAMPVPDAVVIVKGDLIVAVGTSSTLRIPEGTEIVNIRGATILPGFINAHVHMAYNELFLEVWAQAGITTVRDLAAYPPSSSYSLRDQLNLDPKNARLVASGPQMTAVKGFVPPGYPASVFIGTPAEGVLQANRILDEGADLLKIMIESNKYPPMPLECAKAIVETAHQRQKNVSIHISLSRDIETALEAGANDLAHMVNDELSLQLARKVVDAGVYWTPTIEVWQGLGFGKIVLANLRRFVEAGGGSRVVLGTDFKGSYFPFELGMPMKEINWMREAGMTPMQIIVAATRNAADACGLGQELGTVAPGKLADLLIVDGNPLTDLNCLTQVRLVIHSGRIIRKAKNST